MPQTAGELTQCSFSVRILRGTVAGTLILTTVSLVPLYPLLTEWIGSLRLQLCGGILLLAAIAIILRRSRLLLLLSLQLPIHGLWMPVLFHPPPTTNAVSPPDLSICSVNIHVSTESAANLLSVLPKNLPDVIGIQELSSAMWNSLEQHLGSSHPHRLHSFRKPGHFGIGFVSRYPLVEYEHFPLNEDEIPVVNAVLQTPKGKVRIVVSHQLPPLSSEYLRLRSEGLQSIVDRITTARHRQPEIPAILVGDLNCTPWVSEYHRLLQLTEMQDSLNRSNLNATWYPPLFPGCGLIIDHVFFSSELACLSRRTLAYFGSDHRPILTTFRFLRPQSASSE